MREEKGQVLGSAVKVLRVMKALKGRTLNGLSNGELAAALGESPANINRALNTLMAEGLAARRDDGRYALSVAMLQIAVSHAQEMTAAQQRLDEINQRVAAGART